MRRKISYVRACGMKDGQRRTYFFQADCEAP